MTFIAQSSLAVSVHVIPYGDLTDGVRDGASTMEFPCEYNNRRTYCTSFGRRSKKSARVPARVPALALVIYWDIREEYLNIGLYEGWKIRITRNLRAG